MKIINNIDKQKKKIKESIKKYGYCAEHNYTHYQYMQNSKKKNIAFDFGNSGLVLASANGNNKWELFPNGILAPENKKFSLLKKFLNYALIKKKANKVVVEVDENFRKEIVRKFKKQKKYAARRPFVLYWPVFNMANWDPKLRGKKWKKLRNIKNRFYKNHSVRAVKSSTVDKEKLKQILSSWLKRRSSIERVNKEYYTNVIDSNFRDFDFTRTLIVNGNPCTITAGWKIPNSNAYYSSIGIFDYSHKHLGDTANIDDLNNLKKNKINFVDFGGSGKALLHFKKKFKPERIYKTYRFYIARK